MKRLAESEAIRLRTKMMPQVTTKNYREFFTIDEVLLKYQELLTRAERLVEVVRLTLRKNAHLADGNVCALIDLKQGLAQWDASNLNKSDANTAQPLTQNE